MKINNKFDPMIAQIAMPKTNALSVLGDALMQYDDARRKKMAEEIDLEQIRAKIADDRALARKVQGGDGPFQTSAAAMAAYRFDRQGRSGGRGKRRAPRKAAGVSPAPSPGALGALNAKLSGSAAAAPLGTHSGPPPAPQPIGPHAGPASEAAPLATAQPAKRTIWMVDPKTGHKIQVEVE